MDILQMSAWLVGVTGGLTIIYKILKWIEIIVEGNKCQLRTCMVNAYYKYKDAKQIPQYEIENFHKCYNAYKALRGNSFIDDINEEVTSWEIVK